MSPNLPPDPPAGRPPAISPLPPGLRTLDDVLLQHARSRPQALAMRFEGRDVSYGKLARRTARAAARLWHEWGVRPGDRVAWLGLNHPDQITLLFALARIGALLVPLNFRLASAEWQAVLADCTPRCVLHDAAWAQAAMALAQAAGLPAHAIDTLIATPSPGDAPVHATPESPALLVYTSGTTGRPKGAVHTQANLLANMVAASEAQVLTAADQVLTVLPLFHVGGLCIQTLPALYVGAAVLLHARFDAGATLDAINRDRPTLTLQVPATMKALIEHPAWDATDLSGLRAVWAGSSTLPAALVEAFLARGVPLCNVYGATETGPFSIALTPAHAASHAGACGWPARGVEVRLADARDGVGELWLRAPNVVRHYWPDQPAVDPEGWFHSGDLARQAADGSSHDASQISPSSTGTPSSAVAVKKCAITERHPSTYLPRIAGQELRQQQHHRAEQRVLRGRIADVGQARQVGDERRRRDAAGKVVGRDHEDQRRHVMAMAGQPGEQQVAGRAEHRAQHQHAHHAQAHRQHAADEGADQRHDHAVDLGDGGDFVLGVAHVHIERVGHDAHHHVADAVDGDQRQDQHRLPAVAAEEIGKRLDQRAAQPLGHSLAGGTRGAAGSGDSSTVTTPTSIDAAITR
jgi:fatty-acyl-CoA synthase